MNSLELAFNISNGKAAIKKLKNPPRIKIYFITYFLS